MKKNKLGFTLIELLVSLTIISILSVIGLTSYNSISQQSRDTRRKADLESLRSALEMYRSENSYYPDSLSPLVPSKFINQIPVDPKATEYFYNPNPTLTPPGPTGFSQDYALCTKLEIAATPKSGCGTCTTCDYKLTPLGVE